jgi:hypothetical protein
MACAAVRRIVVMRLLPSGGARLVPDACRGGGSVAAMSGDGLGVGRCAPSQARAGSAKIVRPTAKPLTSGARGDKAKLAASASDRALEPEHDDAAHVRVVRADRIAQAAVPGGVASASARASTSRGRRRCRRSARSPRPWCVGDGADLGRDDLEQEFEPVAAGGVGEAQDGGSWSAQVAASSSGWQKQSTLTTCSRGHSARPSRSRADLGLEVSGREPGQLDRAADPEAGAGGGVQRVAAEAVRRRGCRSRGGLPRPRAPRRGRAA